MNRISTLQTGLAKLRRRRFCAQLVERGAIVIAISLSVLSLLLAVDLFWQPAQVARAIGGSLAFAVAVMLVARTIGPMLAKRETDVELALLVEQDRKIDSDLVAALQFQQADAARCGSASLRDRVVRDADQLSRRLIMPIGYSPRRLWRRATMALTLLVVATVLGTVFPGHTSVFFDRLLWGDANYPTHTSTNTAEIDLRVEISHAVCEPDYAGGQTRSVMNPDVQVFQGAQITMQLRCVDANLTSVEAILSRDDQTERISFSQVPDDGQLWRCDSSGTWLASVTGPMVYRVEILTEESPSQNESRSGKITIAADHPPLILEAHISEADLKPSANKSNQEAALPELLVGQRWSPECLFLVTDDHGLTRVDLRVARLDNSESTNITSTAVIILPLLPHEEDEPHPGEIIIPQHINARSSDNSRPVGSPIPRSELPLRLRSNPKHGLRWFAGLLGEKGPRVGERYQFVLQLTDHRGPVRTESTISRALRIRIVDRNRLDRQRQEKDVQAIEQFSAIEELLAPLRPEADTLSSKHNTLEEVRRRGQSLIEEVFDIQLRRIEENGLLDEIKYRTRHSSINEMRQRVAELLRTDVSGAVALADSLEALQKSDDNRTTGHLQFEQIRHTNRRIAWKLAAERLRLQRRLRISRLARDLKKLVSHQSQLELSIQTAARDARQASQMTAVKLHAEQQAVFQEYTTLHTGLHDSLVWLDAKSRVWLVSRLLEKEHVAANMQKAIGATKQDAPLWDLVTTQKDIGQALAAALALLEPLEPVIQSTSPSPDSDSKKLPLATNGKPNQRAKTATELRRLDALLATLQADVGRILARQRVFRTAHRDKKDKASEDAIRKHLTEMTLRLSQLSINETLPPHLHERIRLASEMDRVQEKDPSAQADHLRNVEWATESAYAAVSAELDLTRRKTLGVMIGELARAAETLERTTAAQSELAKAIQSDKPLPSDSKEDILPQMIAEQQRIQTIVGLLDRGLSEIDPTAVAELKEAATALAEIEQHMRREVENDKFAELANQAELKIVSAAELVRQSVRANALALAKESRGQIYKYNQLLQAIQQPKTPPSEKEHRLITTRARAKLAADGARMASRSSAESTGALRGAQLNLEHSIRELEKQSTGAKNIPFVKNDQAKPLFRIAETDIRQRKDQAERDLAAAEKALSAVDRQRHARSAIKTESGKLAMTKRAKSDNLHGEMLPSPDGKQGTQDDPKKQTTKKTADGNATSDDSAVHTAERLAVAQSDFARAQKTMGAVAVSVSGQREVANQPLRSALDAASRLGQWQLKRATRNGTSSSKKPAGKVPNENVSKIESAGNKGTANQNGKREDPSRPGDTESGRPGDGRNSKGQADGSQKSNRDTNLGTDFVPQSPAATARMIAGNEAQSRAERELADRDSRNDSSGRRSGLQSASQTKSQRRATGPANNAGGRADQSGDAAAGVSSSGSVRNDNKSTRNRRDGRAWIEDGPSARRWIIIERGEPDLPREYEDKLKNYYRRSER